MSTKTAIWCLVIGAILALLFLFLPPKLIISWGLGIGRHNDRVLVGTIGLLVAVVSAYRLLRPTLAENSK
ncbi:MAG TPA: hypothetical protein VJH22_06595 [Candidatus Nanoarchaeia archaeon]|nr:hypothetical protein [Candidatus Nanoarchaeia archaeon]